MKTTIERLLPKETYTTPSLRVTDTRLETSFLQSNLEPIDGGDGSEIEW